MVVSLEGVIFILKFWPVTTILSYDSDNGLLFASFTM